MINFGNIAEPKKNAAVPATIVDIYAKTVVPKSTLPEFLPRVAIPGTMNAIIISGITNDKKLPNNALKVEKILTGKVIFVLLQTSPNPIPSINAKKIRFIKDKFFKIMPP